MACCTLRACEFRANTSKEVNQGERKCNEKQMKQFYYIETGESRRERSIQNKAHQICIV